MLDKFKKFLNKKEDPEMKDDKATEPSAIQVDASEAKAELEKIQADFEAFKTEANALIAQADGQVAELKKQVEALVAEKAAMIADAAEKKMSARKEKIVAAIGTTKAEGVMAATKDLDDAQFEAIVSALATSIDAEAKSEMFTEKGASAEADASKLNEETPEMKALKKKYQSE